MFQLPGSDPLLRGARAAVLALVGFAFGPAAQALTVTFDGAEGPADGALVDGVGIGAPVDASIGTPPATDRALPAPSLWGRFGPDGGPVDLTFTFAPVQALSFMVAAQVRAGQTFSFEATLYSGGLGGTARPGGGAGIGQGVPAGDMRAIGLVIDHMAPADALRVRLTLAAPAGAAPTDGLVYAFDNLALTAIPEPATPALAVAGLSGLWLRGRLRRADQPARRGVVQRTRRSRFCPD